MKRIVHAALAASLLLAPALALAAESWGLPDEQTTRFDATVVDLLCELTGDCPADCGGGARQLRLVTDDGEEDMYGGTVERDHRSDRARHSAVVQ